MTNSNDHWRRTEAIFHETVSLAEPTRTTVLETLCAGDTALMEELRALLLACEAEETHGERSHGDESGIPLERVGPYALDRLLGRGGMGAVYLAHRADGHFAQQVAIKLIDLPLATDLFRERFRVERQILAGLVHPYIARLLDGGVSDGGELYLAMEYIDGVSITEFCERGALRNDDRLRLFRKVCDAVQFAHQNLVVHRDLKPDNILVDAEGTPHLLDFGTAKILTPADDDTALNLTRPGLQTFTPRYASPEQVLGRPISTASDTYSLGVLLHVLLTGAYPYELSEFSTEEMVRVICEQAPVGPATFAANVDADLDCIVLKALRKEPQERYSTVEQLSADVQAYLDGRPVQARSGNARYLAAKFVRRNRLALAAAALLLATLLAGVGGILWQAHVATVQRRKAEARSADLRELSNSLLSELHDALKEIPGSTGAQKLLVTRVLEHLDRMAKDSDGDQQTQLDLIDAYTQLGNVQGNIYYQNVADTVGAVASFDRALALATPLAALHPKDKDVLRAEAAALEARGESLSNSGDPMASVTSLQAAVRVFDRMIGLPGVTARHVFEAAIAYETLGSELAEDTGLSDVEAGSTAYRHALAMDEQALRMDPKYAAVRRGIPVMHLHLGALVVDTDPAKALGEFDLALRMQAALPADQLKTLQQVRLRAVMLKKEAEACVELGRYSDAETLYVQARETFDRLLAADAKNAAALTDVQRVTDDEAHMYELAADSLMGQTLADRHKNLLAAKDKLERDVVVTQQIIALEPSHEPWTLVLAAVTLRLDAVRQALGMPLRDAGERAGSLNVLRHAADAPSASPSDIDLAVNATLNAAIAVHTGVDTAAAAGWAERGVALTHARSPAYLLLLARADRANHMLVESADAARKGLALPGCRTRGSPCPGCGSSCFVCNKLQTKKPGESIYRIFAAWHASLRPSRTRFSENEVRDVVLTPNLF